MKRICSVIDSISDGFFSIAWFLTFLLVILVVQQVVGRYFFEASSIGLQELEWHIFGFIICFSIAYTLRCDGHVRVDILSAHFPRRIKLLIHTIGMLLIIPLSLGLAWFGLQDVLAAREFANPIAHDFYSTYLFGKEGSLYEISAAAENILRTWILLGEGSPNPGGLEARWIIKAAVPIGMILLALQAFAELIRPLSSEK